MATPLEMPKLGNTVEDCLLARWNKRVGDTVNEGELVAEIETDKATFELTSPVAGTLLATFFQAGDLVAVFTNICVIGAPGESVAPFQPQASPAPPTERPPSEPPPSRADQAAVSHQPAPPVRTAPLQQGFYSPRAKRFAARHGFRPEHVAGSGPRGRVLEDDLKRLYYASPRPTSLAKHLLDSGFEPREEAVGRLRATDLGPPPEKMSHIRERVARRLRESLAVTAQFTMNASANATGLLALRARIKARGETPGLPDINLNEMVMFCAVKALALMPEVNVGFAEGKIYRHADVNIGFACDTPRGLLVPVVKQAGTLSLADLAVRVKALTRQALDGAISPDDLAGGTFTVSNLGVYGIESFSPILNPPQVAILGVNSIDLKAVRRDGAIVFVEHIGLSLTCDHQVIDGAPGARFLKVCREQIENVEAIAGLEI
ncbi:MAG: dihydrolipoamide acetyltransferase family protein [Candidatus Solibacter sp.]|nr:dihydrolipoamide acetyltransferase family protein [Candidatus Solibacter sp.]